MPSLNCVAKVSRDAITFSEVPGRAPRPRHPRRDLAYDAPQGKEPPPQELDLLAHFARALRTPNSAAGVGHKMDTNFGLGSSGAGAAAQGGMAAAAPSAAAAAVGGAGSLDEDGGGEDEDSSSSTSTLTPTGTPTPEDDLDLEEFRLQWQEEMRSKGRRPRRRSSRRSTSSQDGSSASVTAGVVARNHLKRSPQETEEEERNSIFERAKELFLEGVELERVGQHFSAIQKYKRAVQLVPDIEYRTFEDMRRNQQQQGDDNGNQAEDAGISDNQADQVDLEGDDGAVEDLIKKFSAIAASQGLLCQPETAISATHIGALPMELVIQILKWVVSKSLDIRSLERCSEVCRGFYLASRASDLWRLICFNTWGVNSLPEHSSDREVDWRAFYMSRPRVLLSGCYIASISYAREGERGFQDNEFYRSWHMVRYFRYFRFLSEGRATMLTTAEEPREGVRMLNAKFGVNLQGAYHGHYRLVGNRVILSLKKPESEKISLAGPSLGGGGGRRRRNRAIEEETHVPDQEYRIELEITGKRWNQLRWLSYDVLYTYRNGHEARSAIDIRNPANFPPMVFSRVLSYSNHSDSALA